VQEDQQQGSRRQGLDPAGRESNMLLRSETFKEDGVVERGLCGAWVGDALEVISKTRKYGAQLQKVRKGTEK
jgi:hypothetical protein